MDCQMWFETFAKKCPQNAGNAIFREPNFKNFPGGHAPVPPPPEICRDFGLMFLESQISVGLPSWTEASTPLVKAESK